MVPIIKGKADLDCLEANPEIISAWTCKNDISINVSVYKPDVPPASIQASREAGATQICTENQDVWNLNMASDYVRFK